jgi:hypothetical protein
VAAAITIEEVAMLNHPTVERLRDLGLVGMIHAFEEQRRQPDSAQLSFEDRLAMLVESRGSGTRQQAPEDATALRRPASDGKS